MLFFQFIVNGMLTGLGIVQYDPRVILGLRLVYAPVEDLGFGFGMVTLTLSAWVWLGPPRRAEPALTSGPRPRRRAPGRRSAPGGRRDTRIRGPKTW